ncbi:MAG: cysteine--tRNA ligase [bacterium]|nr:cysteine--tRNA ligase [bacterium]
MKIYNSISRQIEEFVPLKKGQVGMYTCGPTVYMFAHIGHGRKYVYDDVLRRLLTADGFKVTHVQNITDVGHLVSDADEGEDKLEKGARLANKTVWEVAQMFTDSFFADMDKLNILRPDISCKATDHIPAQIKLVQKLVDKGFAYDTPEAVYFDVAKFPRYDHLFGQNLQDKLVAARSDVVTGSYKKNPVDFALWFKRIGKFADHSMHWDSPWGDGFPGWHIECSAMSMEYLGETFDIHTGGEDHLSIHHPNEIAQAEAATGKPLARYWVHHGFLMVDGAKMSKSLGNVYRVTDVMDKGFSSLALRYFFLTAHYKTPQNFTWSAVAAAQSAYDKVVSFVRGAQTSAVTRISLSKEKLKKIDEYRDRFWTVLNNDMNVPQGLAVMWEMLKSNIPDRDKLDLLLDFDQVLGLDLVNISEIAVPDEVKQLAAERERLRKSGEFVKADEVRMQVEKMGYTINDTAHGPTFTKK